VELPPQTIDHLLHLYLIVGNAGNHISCKRREVDSELA
jgi:hypothetical protein